MYQEYTDSIRKYISHIKCENESKLLLHALRWVEKGYSLEKMENRCFSYINKSDSKYLSMKIHKLVKSKVSKRMKGPIQEIDRKRPRSKSPAPKQFSNENVKILLEEARKKLEMKKIQMNLDTIKVSVDEDDENDSLSVLNARIASGMYASGIVQAPLILDKTGRTISMQTGRAVVLEQNMPTLKANLRVGKSRITKKLTVVSKHIVKDEPAPIPSLKIKQISRTKLQKKDFHHDPNINVKSSGRDQRPLKLNTPGKYERIANRLRSQAKLEALQSNITAVAKETGILKAAKLAAIQPSAKSIEMVETDVEWWDSLILNDQNYENFIVDKLCGITNLIEHPVEVKPSDYPTKPINIKLKLTKKECKKLRRQERSINLKEHQEKIRLGLLPPLAPKVRISNLMRVLGSEAVLDPTKVESYVRSQMEKRQKTHIEANESRKLSHDQKIEKIASKVRQDTNCGFLTTVYLVRSLANPSHKFKVEANAKELMLTGILALYHDFCLVVVEGGKKQQKKYKRLMMHRIKWNDNLPKMTEKFAKLKDNKCNILWEGHVKESSFEDFKVKLCPNEKFAREIFRRNKAEHYWDLAFTKAVIDNAD
ncbi:Pre-mRNA-splicing factor 3 [Intoshia linei]|uniref:Pre-mRNA-splicing factor 3 n=1 Tax=Intoshia linei TaxID=1819745 RepID=A0A177B3V2_9BILA|nr:Pre-mRNA-splicing factor 3 [Intoshia linei]